MDIMSEIMNENEPGKENPDDLQLLDVCICIYNNVLSCDLSQVHGVCTGRAGWL